MVVSQKERGFFLRLLRPVFLCAVLAYLGLHALNGNHGIYAWLKEKRRLEVQQQELAALRDQRMAMEHRVALMSNKSLDLDLLEEQARKVLGYSAKDEFILLPEDASKN
jgi:cell division protein FtsB